MQKRTGPPRAGTTMRRRPPPGPLTRGRAATAGHARDRRAAPRSRDLLSIEVRPDGRRPTVRVSGELDVSGAGLLTAMLEHARTIAQRDAGVAAPRPVVVDVDLAEVTFVDTHGLAPVLDSPTRVVGASAAVLRLLLLVRPAPVHPPVSLRRLPPGGG